MATLAAMPVPTSGQLWAAYVRFGYTVAAVTIFRDRAGGESWISPAVAQLAQHASRHMSEEMWDDVVRIHGELGAPALAGLFLEITHVNLRFEPVATDLFGTEFLPDIDEGAREFIGTIGKADPFARRDVDQIEIVYGSIEKLLKRLPKWLQKVMEVVMELLKLTHGET